MTRHRWWLIGIPLAVVAAGVVAMLLQWFTWNWLTARKQVEEERVAESDDSERPFFSSVGEAP